MAVAGMDFGYPMLLIGDFNVITDSTEKRGGRGFNADIEVREFRNFVNSSSLIDLGFSGSAFTWCNNRFGHARVWERLDRALANDGWINYFPDSIVTHLPRIGSDHCPLLLQVSSQPSRNRRSPLRFHKFWLSIEGIQHVVRRAWCGPSGASHGVRLLKLLRNTRQVIV
ncbi:uncharacterized protein [Elaeis guineensis]|uniref:uncharacterized protein n=1 Tax=Elaeis guineensis var. tenera TaxID=51953 RepID=UPI003C6D9E25